MNESVGIIGLGLLGSAIAERLLQTGYRVVGYDVRPEAREALEANRGTCASSCEGVAHACSRIILSLPTSPVVGEVLTSLQPALTPQHLLLDTTTGAPEDTEAHAEKIADKGAAFLDATVAGSSQQARAGEVLIMVGGAAAAYERGRDLIASLSSQHFHLGPVGSAARMKLVVNVAIGLHRAVFAEALGLGEAFGFSAQQVLDVLSASPAYSRMMDVKGPKMVARDFSPQARLRQHLKDVQLILAAGAQNQAAMPLSEVHQRLLSELVEAGWGDADNSAILRAFRPD